MQEDVKPFAILLKSLLRRLDETTAALEAVNTRVREPLRGENAKVRSYTLREALVYHVASFGPLAVLVAIGISVDSKALVIAGPVYLVAYVMLIVLFQVIGEHMWKKRTPTEYDSRRLPHAYKELRSINQHCEECRQWAANAALAALTSTRVTESLLDEGRERLATTDQLPAKVYEQGCACLMIAAKSAIRQGRYRMIPVKSTVIMWKALDQRLHVGEKAAARDWPQLWTDAVAMVDDLRENRADHRYALWWALGAIIITVTIGLISLLLTLDL